MCEGSGVRATGVAVDLRDRDSVTECCGKILDILNGGKIDLLVCAAGVSQRFEFGEGNGWDVDVEREVFEVNFFSQICLLKFFMGNRNGRGTLIW